MKMVNVSISEQERDALVKMLEHEHFSYGTDGMLALAGYKKIRDTPAQERGEPIGELLMEIAGLIALLAEGMTPANLQEQSVALLEKIGKQLNNGQAA